MTDSTGVSPSADTGRRLVLVRHAKAASDTGGSDRSRPLTGRGRADASALGSRLADRLDRVDAAWVSTAVRARQTWDAIAGHLSDRVARAPELRDELYDAGREDLVHLVRGADDDLRTLVLVGHNPTFEQAQAWLTGEGRGFPTGSAAIIGLDSSWADVSAGSGRLVGFVTH